MRERPKRPGAEFINAYGDRRPGSRRIDLRIDYLRPGIGERFVLEAEVLRLGSRVASTRMSSLDVEGKLLASGAAAYIVS
ncbi:MAG TPA: hotdog domain-containing protein [Thauera sp.]|uniref:hotdog domain-containing protein n=1 Tax=Thauera sp. SWB20 TaxID=1572758 RepID=UPI0005AE0DCE|nr:hotdog domain-containing protein [Thauera sp. SWB20]KIN91393.1 thioesterase superfamily protein [Thauera sp. SWB20]HNR62442.1 hotdog domain-containing protein [Thauera sp.]